MRTDVGPKYNIFMKCDARDYRWGTRYPNGYIVWSFCYIFIWFDCLVAWLSDYALIRVTHSACQLWFIECGRNKRNNLITDFRVTQIINVCLFWVNKTFSEQNSGQWLLNAKHEDRRTSRERERNENNNFHAAEIWV